MSEEIKAKVVEGDNPSIAEKETKVLKKMGLDTGTETVTKVDLRKPKEEKDAIQEQSTDEIPVRNESSNSEEVQKENEAQPENPAEQSQEKEETVIEQIVDEPSAKTIKPESSAEPKPVKKEEEPVLNIPEGVSELVNFMNDTGGSMEDYIKLNKNYSELEGNNLLHE